MAEATLRIEALTKRFGALIANDHVDLDVLPGELHAIIGPNGAGKTTLISQLAGELAPNEGRIIFNGRDITHMPSNERALMGLARSYQITSVVTSFTALDNVALAAQAIDGHSYRFWRPARLVRHLNDKAAEILNEIGLGARQNVLASNMSHGEHRQLEIAMALATEPKLLLLDEPTAGMGPAATEGMIGYLRSLKGRLTILLIEHDMDVVFTLADRISVLVNGGRIATDTPDKIREDPQVRRAYLGDKAVSLRPAAKDA
ncbi:MAG TPA: ABC transporter ATP-binding protein [Alphaproteobacteria bacterium]|nr:ABC transporter ATP-binding protein [Alphaproteobacteria bacterium]